MDVRIKQSFIGGGQAGKWEKGGEPIYSKEWWLFIDYKGNRKAVKVGSKEAAKAKAVFRGTDALRDHAGRNQGTLLPET